MGNPWIPHFDSSSTSSSSTRPSSPGIAQNTSNEGTHSGTGSAFSTRLDEDFPNGQILTTPNLTFTFALETAIRNFWRERQMGDSWIQHFDSSSTSPSSTRPSSPELETAIRDFWRETEMGDSWIPHFDSSSTSPSSTRPSSLGEVPVDIRKYTVQERSQLPLFCKGVQALSRTVIHANVARLLGISTQERSLIYKQFSDRTLHDSLHNSPSDRPSWEERLKIALGTARGLAFAHSKGLYHGNVNSSNILLDEKCNCKLVEFGVARLWSKNTLLNSSSGYVDQEYMNSGTNQLIASMDVYSFGVVLVELITGQDPSSKAFDQRGSSLAMLFISAVDEWRLREVLDHNIWAEERNEQLRGVADLAKECLQQVGKERPKMLRVRNILSKWVPKGPRPQVQGWRPTNAAGSRPGVARNSNLQDQAQLALDVSQNISQGGDDGVFES